MSKKLYELIISIRKKCLRNEENVRTELNLTPAEFQSLLVIEPEEKILGHIFSQRMCLSPSRGSRVISRLMKDGFVEQQIVPDNRRRAEIYLTTIGIQMRKQVVNRMEECEKKITSQLTRSQSKQVRETLELLANIM